MQRLGGVVAAMLFLLLMTGAASAGGYGGGDHHTTTTKHECPEGEEWNKYRNKCKPTTTTTTMNPSETTTTTEPSSSTSTPESTTSIPESTTTSTIQPASTTSAPTESSTTTVVSRSLEPYTFCDDGATWIGVEFSGYPSVLYWLEDPTGSPDGELFDSEAVRHGVLLSDTFFTFIGVGATDPEAILNVPATDCDEVTALPTIVTTTNPVEELPFTGVEENLILLGISLLSLGGVALLTTKGARG